MMLIKKLYDKLVTKVNLNKILKERLKMLIIGYLMLSPNYNTKSTEIENKIPSITGLVTTTALNATATYTKNKIPDIITLATKAALNAKAAAIEILIIPWNLAD